MAATTSAFEAELRAGTGGFADPTNYVTNPSFELGLANWAAYGGAGVSTLSRVQVGGAWVCRITAAAANALYGTQQTPTNTPPAMAVTPGQTVAARARLLAASAGRMGRAQVQFRRVDNSVVSSVSGTPVAPGNDAVTVVTVPAEAAFAVLVVSVENTAGVVLGETMDWDRTLLALVPPETAVAPDYFDGDTDGYGWTGTAYGSTSRRVVLFSARDRGLMAGAAYKLRQNYLDGQTDPGAHTAAKANPRQLKALTDTAMLASFDAIGAP